MRRTVAGPAADGPPDVSPPIFRSPEVNLPWRWPFPDPHIPRRSCCHTAWRGFRVPSWPCRGARSAHRARAQVFVGALVARIDLECLEVGERVLGVARLAQRRKPSRFSASALLPSSATICLRMLMAPAHFSWRISWRASGRLGHSRCRPRNWKAATALHPPASNRPPLPAGPGRAR